MIKLFSTKKFLIISIVLILALAGAGKWMWWRKVYSKPENVFGRMLSNSLSTRSVTRHSSQTDGFQTLKQDTQYVGAPLHQVNVLSNLRQENDSDTVIITENLTDKDNNFVRYKSISTAQKSSSGQDFNFSNVLNVWGQAPATENSNSITQSYIQNIVVPFAYLNPDNKRTLINQINKENVYEVDYSAVTRRIINGRPTYIYPVTVKPVPYINMVKTFAKLFKATQLDDVNTDDYASIPPLKFEFEVDVWSSQLTKIIYTGSEKTEAITSHGARSIFTKPDTTITLEELQARLQQLQ